VSAVVGAMASIAAAALIAVTGYAGPAYLAAGLAVVVIAVAIGWGPLLGLPQPAGSALLIILTGAAAVLTALRPPDPDHPLTGFASLLAFAIIAAFLHELIRRDGRIRMVESVAGTFFGQLMAMFASGWMLLPDAGIGAATLLVAAVAVACARAATALPWPVAVTGWVAFVAGTGGAILAAATQGPIQLGPAAALGLAVAATVAAMDRLLATQPAGREGFGLLSAAIAPVAIAGTVAFAAVSLLGS